MGWPVPTFDPEAVRAGRDAERAAVLRLLEAMIAATEQARRAASPLAVISVRDALEGVARNLDGAAKRIRDGGHR